MRLTSGFQRLTRRMLNSRRGFTLIELLIVIAIVLILIAIALPNFLDAQLRARVVRVRADLRTVSIGMDSYFIDWGIYPPDHDPDSLGVDSSGLFQLTTPLSYLKELPVDIFNTGSVGLSGSEIRWFEMASTGLDTFSLLRGFPNPPVVHTFAVYSQATDGREGFQHNDQWPFNGEGPPCPRRIGFVNYSTTNGSKSTGDIVHLGGEFNSGLYCVDEWKVVSGKRPIYR